MFEQLDAITGGRAPVVAAVLAAIMLLVMLRFARTLEPRLVPRFGVRIAKYLAAAMTTTALGGAVLVIVLSLAWQNGIRDTVAALADFGLRLGFAADEGAALTAGMFAASALVSGLVTWVRGLVGGAPTQAALDVLPVTPAETAVFGLVLVPLGSLSEEIVYRGFVMGQLWGWTGNAWIAAVLAAVLFGIMHRYQGTWGMLRTGLIGLVFAVGVIATGSLVPSILAHVLANLGGTILRVDRAKAA